MPTLNPAPAHKPINSYSAALDRFTHLNLTHETAVRSAFQSLLEHCARQIRWTLVPEHAVNPHVNKRVIVDGALIDDFHLALSYWEAKDIHNDLPAEVERKFAAGYPRDNILFQSPPPRPALHPAPDPPGHQRQPRNRPYLPGPPPFAHRHASCVPPAAYAWPGVIPTDERSPNCCR